MTRGRGIIGIFWEKWIFFKGFGSLKGQSASFGNLGGHPKKM
jgi:hypothetical protein